MAGFEFEGADHDEEQVRISGVVKWFDPGKGYGFIVPDDPNQTGLKDVLLHVTSLRNAGRDSALEGSVIVCDVIRRPKGWQVAEVVEIDETAAARTARAPARRPCPRPRPAAPRTQQRLRQPRRPYPHRRPRAGEGEMVQPHQGLWLRGARP